MFSFLVTRHDPSMKVVPAMRQLILAALNILSATVDGKQACLFQSIIAYWLVGLVKVTNSKLNTMLPNENARTAIPETLFRCLGYCDHKQFSTAIELMDKQDIGTTKQHRPKMNRLMWILIAKGNIANSRPQMRITFLQPQCLVRAVANIIAKVEGMMVQSKMMELVREVMWVPWFLRQEKKQMLVAPQMPSIPAANLVSMQPKRVSSAGLSASLSILSIFRFPILLLIIPSYLLYIIKNEPNPKQLVLEYICSNQYILSLVEQVQVVLFSLVQRPPLVLLIHIRQQHYPGMPTQNLL